MRIGIYAQVARDAKPTGIGLHVRELVQALAAIDRTNEYLLYYPAGWGDKGVAFPDLPLPANFRPRPVRFPSRWAGDHMQLWWKWYLPWFLRRDRLDVFHGPNHFLAPYKRGRTVVTIHDLAYFHMPVHGPIMDEMLRTWTRRALQWADAVIALSENTRRDIEALGVPPERIRVIYGGGRIVPESQIQYERVGEMRKTLGVPERYILFVGTLQPRKNVPFLVRGFARLKRETGLPHKLVLAGHRDVAGDEIEALARELGIADDVIITGYVESWHLPLLYKGADLFVLPTRYEGFTLVTLEAMAYGTPVIATDTSSIREGVGDAALLVEVDDDVALASQMKSVLTDDVVRSRLIASGRDRTAMFTWANNARETLSLYRELGAGSLPHKSVPAESFRPTETVG